MEVPAFLRPSADDSATAADLKEMIRDTPELAKLETDLAKWINKQELLRVSVPVRAPGNNDRTIDPFVEGSQRAIQIIESVKGDGRFFKQLIAAISFVEKRRHFGYNNYKLEQMRSKYTELGKSRRRRSSKKTRKSRKQTRRSV
jgi:hypothetical protein